jgi:hypothetical protein
MVKSPTDTPLAKYRTIQDDLRLQYFAEMISAKSAADVEASYNDLLSEMSNRGHDKETTAQMNALIADFNKSSFGKAFANVKVGFRSLAVETALFSPAADWEAERK